MWSGLAVWDSVGAYTVKHPGAIAIWHRLCLHIYQPLWY